MNCCNQERDTKFCASCGKNLLCGTEVGWFVLDISNESAETIKDIDIVAPFAFEGAQLRVHVRLPFGGEGGAVYVSRESDLMGLLNQARTEEEWNDRKAEERAFVDGWKRIIRFDGEGTIIDAPEPVKSSQSGSG